MRLLSSLPSMTPQEHEFFGEFYLVLVAIFFIILLPIGSLLRKRKQRELDEQATFEVGGDRPPPLPSDPYAASSPSLHEMNRPSGWLGAQQVIGRLDLLGLGMYVFLFYSFWAGAAVGGLEGEGELSSGVLVANIIMFLLLGALVPFVMFRRVSVVEFFGLKWEKWPWIFAISPLFVVGLLLIAGVVMGLTGYPQWVEVNFGGKQQEVVEVLRETVDPVLLTLLAVSAVIVAPLAEEFIFRGYIYPVAKKYTGIWVGALFSGVLFGVIHFNLMGLPVLCLFGVALALIYEKTKSIWVPIACHAAFNGFQVSVVFLDKMGVFELPS